MFFVLPYAENQAIYDQFEQYLNGTKWPNAAGTAKTAGVGFVPWSNGNTSVLNDTFYKPLIPFYHCPSDGTSKQLGGDVMARTNYNVNLGDNWQYNYQKGNGVFRGMFGYLAWFDMSACSDGTSNTALMSEQVIGANSNTEIVTTVTKASIKDGAIRHSGVVASPQTCLSYQTGNEVSGTKFDMWRGRTRFSGRTIDTGFLTVLPPNSVSCYGWNPTSDYYASGLMAATSNHSGGVQVSRVDGSVSFISNTINCGDLTTTTAPTTGKSPYGVWGGLGTRNGGESTTL